MEKLFNENNFSHTICGLMSCELPEHKINKNHRDLANSIFEKWLESGKMIYGNGLDSWTIVKYPHDTYQAVLVNIEPIQAKCEHLEVVDHKNINNEHGYHCKECGKELKPVGGWEEV